jgi:hypothetical protein
VRLTRVRWVTCFRPSPLPSTLVRASTTREWRNGRRAGLRIRCPKGRGSSTLPSRTAYAAERALFALRIAGTADAHLQTLGVFEAISFWTALLDRYLSQARADLGPGAAAAWEAGQRLTLERAMDEALTPEPSE